MDISEASETVQAVLDGISEAVISDREFLETIAMGLLANGHVLLEDVPGTGKTLTGRSLARALGLEFSRIQFTPDLLPTDVTGTHIYNERTGEFEFSEGPIFGNVVLADEINRAPPKSQAALLEAMEEEQVTADGETFKLPSPFFVIATQNPVEQEGSLHPDELLLMEGRLWRAGDALAYAKSQGRRIHDGTVEVYDIEATTLSLTVDGEIVERDCYLYTTDYDGQMYTVETATGRNIRVSGNHPFLVKTGATLTWKHARELEIDDELLTPATLELPERAQPTHAETLAELSDRETATVGGSVGEDQSAPAERTLTIEDELTPAGAGWFVGVIHRDGSARASEIIVHERTSTDRFDRWVELATSMGASPSVDGAIGDRTAIVSSEQVIDYLHIRYDLLTPERIISAPAAFRDGFLTATVGRNICHIDASEQITITVSNTSLRDLIWYLLLERDVHVRVDTDQLTIEAPRDEAGAGIDIIGDVGGVDNRHQIVADGGIDAVPVRPSSDHASRHPSVAAAIGDSSVEVERIVTLEKEPYSGPVIGLSVPQSHNYLGGRGACGINHNTFPLPEAQLDRFMVKTSIGYPDLEGETTLLRRRAARESQTPEVESIIDAELVKDLRHAPEKVHVDDDVIEYIAAIAQATREQPAIRIGVSPRGTQRLFEAARARAVITNRDYVTPDDVKWAAKPVLGHRLILTPDAKVDNINPHDLIDRVLEGIPVPTVQH